MPYFEATIAPRINATIVAVTNIVRLSGEVESCLDLRQSATSADQYQHTIPPAVPANFCSK
jgi:hypothetical protein